MPDYPVENQDPNNSFQGPRIPSIRKVQPPYGFGYPIGASAVSEALADLPQFPKFTMALITAPTPDRPLLGQSRYPILRLTFTNYPEYTPRTTSNFKIRQGGERWHIDIFAVPGERRENVRDNLVKAGLPLLREWLSGPDAPTADMRRKSIIIWFTDATAKFDLILEEGS